MKLEYGPPAVGGVKHLQYLSADEPDYSAGSFRRPSVALGAGALVLWAMGYRNASNVALVAAIAASLAGK